MKKLKRYPVKKNMTRKQKQLEMQVSRLSEELAFTERLLGHERNRVEGAHELLRTMADGFSLRIPRDPSRLHGEIHAMNTSENPRR